MSAIVLGLACAFVGCGTLTFLTIGWILVVGSWR